MTAPKNIQKEKQRVMKSSHGYPTRIFLHLMEKCQFLALDCSQNIKIPQEIKLYTYTQLVTQLQCI